MGFRIDQQDHGGRHPLDVGRQLRAEAHQRVQRRQSRRIWRLQVERRGKGEDRLVQGLSRSESRVESPNRRRLRRAEHRIKSDHADPAFQQHDIGRTGER